MAITPAKKTTSDVTKNIISVTQNITSAAQNTSQAIEYWQKELATKSQSTRDTYLSKFLEFLMFTGKTADELLKQREKDQNSKNPKIRRTIESLLIQFISAKAQQGFKPATLQIYFASVRSFFEIHYCPLQMRRGDYPKGESLGVKAATKDAILKALNSKRTRNKIEATTLILFLKDSGLRASDARLLNYENICKELEDGSEFIPITRITQKVKTTAKTFIGPEAIHAIKEYVKARQKGTRRLPPETLTDKSPLFRTWKSKTVKRIPRYTLSSVIRNAFNQVNEPHTSAHSLRKYLQTSLEASGVNTNWIDQIIGHKLINSRDAYSKPTDEQLKEAYVKAYKFIRIFPEIDTPTTQTSTTQPSQTGTKPECTTNPNQVTCKYTATIDGIQL
jgi:integrase